jgi:NAD(P)-dependent dehydrogenase (short-subunit alcohol dehydrogenase family)
MTTFRDRVALITGAGSGIGGELARRLAAEGARVAALDRSPEGLAGLVASLPGCPVATAVADVTDAGAMRHAVGSLEAALGPTDLLIACAGIGRKTSTARFDAEEFNAHIRVNLIGIVNSVAPVIAGMRQRRSGHLVALSSVASYRGLPLMGAYCASKAGVNALCESLRAELRPLGIDVTTVCPAWIRTAMTQGLRVPAGDIMPLEVAAGIILDAIRRKKEFVAFPRRMVWRMRLLNCLPRAWADRLILRDMTRAGHFLEDR